MNNSSKNKRILLFCHEYPPLGGGGGDFVRDLTESISRRYENVTIDLVAYGNNKIFNKEPLDLDRINIRRVGTDMPRESRATTGLLGLLLYPFFAFFPGFKLLLKNNYDQIYSVNVIPAGLIGYIMSFLFRKKHYITVIAGDIYQPTRKYSPHKHLIMRVLISFLLNKAYKVNCISKDVKAKIYEFYSVSKDVTIVNLGVPLKNIPSLDVEKFDKFTYVCLARLDPRKGYDLLIKAYGDLKNAEDTQLVIMGDGPEQEKLDGIVEDLGLQDRVVFLGYIAGKEKYINLAKSHCFAMASYHEGFGLVYVESLYNHIPVLSTSNGGVEDIVEEEFNGLLSPVGDKVALTNIMQRVLDDQDLLRSMSKNSRESVMRFDIDVITDGYLNFLDCID